MDRLLCFGIGLACLVSVCACAPEREEQRINSSKAEVKLETGPGDYSNWADVSLDTLKHLSVPALRSRNYGSSLTLVKQLGDANNPNEYVIAFSSDGSSPYSTFIANYESDGLALSSRIDVPPGPAPAEGYPVVVFVHGWYGRQDAPEYDFMFSADSQYAQAIDAYVDAGFIVFSPSLRGHGTIDGRSADGLEFLDAWDNGSYLSPMYYAIDVLNLVDSLDRIDWGSWRAAAVKPDLSRIHIAGQSQGGDAVLTALAVSGEGSRVQNAFTSGSIWSGCFGPRFAQVEIYGPMANTLEAFMSGDGSWTGTAVGKDGSINPNFIFGWPPDWIGTTDIQSPDWTWQAQTWSVPSVYESLVAKYSEMYDAINTHVADINDAVFSMSVNEQGKAVVNHDPRIANAMSEIGGFGYEQFLTEPLLLHHSDRDYYSIPAWNADLALRINSAGGTARDYVYPGNTHGLLVSKHNWFSNEDTREGFGVMLARDIALIQGKNPDSVLDELQ